MKTVDSMWADDAEFYHDKGGLMVGRQNIVDAIKNNLCGKVNRQLVAGTLEVYPLNGYGAVEIGVHRFYHPYEQDHGEVGEAKFIHVWQNKEGVWKITRVISYDHAAAKGWPLLADAGRTEVRAADKKRLIGTTEVVP